ncbi:GNAT family N-acetyltransferase [Bacillus sp. NEB1478]|uniref:GNAT family N-acetyltransferase n=1 Tax=Bacillus sp. NEB1478 TaxID=3073816 RepID=UPI002873E541|nr:GNAT family N-acetyltransferase [Bacillus sp. NEB1478]WNB92147.1 GNAT family N-acetyltransferase [Bacillus sp. NEB1478]
MYIRNRIPGEDDPYLIDMVVDNFKVKKETIRAILKHANEVLIVCDEDDQIAGFVSYRFRLGDMVYVDYVVLDDKHQGKGIASSFLPVFEKHLLNQGIRKVFGTVDEDNREALRLFLRWGFNVMGQLGSSIIIEKQLTSHYEKNGQPVAKENNVKRLNTPPILGGR